MRPQFTFCVLRARIGTPVDVDLVKGMFINNPYRRRKRVHRGMGEGNAFTHAGVCP